MINENFVNSVYRFNDMSGQSVKTSVEDLRNQLKLIKEEVKEIEDGLDLLDYEEILDGCVDTLYVVEGLLQKLYNLGFDVDRAKEITAKNNDTKFLTDADGVEITLRSYTDKGVEVTAKYNVTYDSWVILDKNNKVQKPVGYVKNNLSSCVPEEFK